MPPLHQGRIDTRSTAMVRHCRREHRLTSADTSACLRRVPLSPARHQRGEGSNPYDEPGQGTAPHAAAVAISFLAKTMALSRTSMTNRRPGASSRIATVGEHRRHVTGEGLSLL
jgi:hypothetical protein